MVATQILKKNLNAYIFGTNAHIKAKLVSKHVFYGQAIQINMFVKTCKDFWLTKSKMATLDR